MVIGVGRSAVEARPSPGEPGGEIELPVGVELPVGDHELGLVRARRQVHRVDCRAAGHARVERVADQIEAGETRIDVLAVVPSAWSWNHSVVASCVFG